MYWFICILLQLLIVLALPWAMLLTAKLWSYGSARGRELYLADLSKRNKDEQAERP